MTIDLFTPTRTASRPAGVRLLDAAPEFQLGVPHDDLRLARQKVVAPRVTAPCGPLGRLVHGVRGRPLAALVLEGLVVRRTRLGDRAAAELLGPGDVLDLDVGDDPAPSAIRTEHIVHRTCSLAVLDDRFRLAAARWPRLYEVIQAQLGRQLRRASRNLAMLHLSRVEDRLAELFCELAERWGRVTSEGIVLDVDLTHLLIGELVGSRRPTVSLALSDLAATGAVVRRVDRSWLISPGLLSQP